jgi:hypothetical protein
MPQLRQNVDQASFRVAFNCVASLAVETVVVFPPVDEPVPRTPSIPAKKILPVDGAGRASALSLSGGPRLDPAANMNRTCGVPPDEQPF